MSLITFEEFVQKVKDGIVDAMPERYKGSTVDVSTKTKVNRNATGLQVIPEGIETTIYPSLNIENFYERYVKTENLQGTINAMAEAMDEAFAELDNMNRNFKIDDLDKDKVFMQLINTESNRELLSMTPHREFNDMSVIYRVCVSLDDDGLQSVMITDPLAEELNLSEEELFELASKQTKELFPPEIKGLNEVLSGFFTDTGLDNHEAGELMDDIGMNELGAPLVLVSNKYYVQGATMMLYDDVLQDVSNRLGGDIYVMPSSIHEFLALPVSLGNPEDLQEMVTSINEGSVREEERLSNQVFHYDAEKRELTQITNNPVLGIKDADYKKPDMIITAPPLAASMTR